MRAQFFFTVIFSIAFWSNSSAQVSYKEMMKDPAYNFYEVVDAAETYFQTHDKGKGSGWKGYQRWKNEEEGKYYPSGRRDNVSHFFVEEAYSKVQSTMPRYAERSGSPVEWKDLGPYDANNVTSHYSEGIGRVEAVYVNPQNTDLIYMGSRSGGFWRTTDGGSSWLCSTDTLVATGVNTIAVSPGNPDSVLINVRNARNGYSHGIYRSADGGMSWTRTKFNPDFLGWGGLGRTGRINIVAISPFDPSVVMIASDRGLYRSTNDLDTYTRVRSGNFTQVMFHPTKSNVVYAYDRNNANRNELFRSSDGGATFTKTATATGNNNNTNVRIGLSKNCPDCVYFSSSNGVWKSTDDGQSFAFLSNPNQSCHGFAISDLDTSKMIYGYVDIMASSDGGQNFNQVTYWSTGNSNHRNDNYVHADLRIAIAVGGVFYVGTDGYLCKSSDGGTTWERLNDGTGIREFYRLGLSQSDVHLTMAGSQDNGTSIYNRNGWLEWNGGDGMEAVIQQLNEDWMVGSWQYGNRNRTQDGGQTRRNIKHGGTTDWNAPMFYNPNHQFQIYSFSNVIYRSDEFGGNWDLLSVIPAGSAKKASVAENNPNIMLIIRNNEMYLSEDGGHTLSSLKSQLPRTASIADVAFDPNDDSTLVLIYETYQDNNGRVYKSQDLGQNWENISFNLSPMPANDVVIDRDGNIYIGAEIGVYTMHLEDSVWNNHGTGLPNVSVEELEIQYATNTLRIVSWGRGMWEAPLVGRADYPRVETIRVSQTPTLNTPSEDHPQHVTAKVDYKSGTLARAYVVWSKDTPTFNQSTPMTNISGNTYQTQSPIPEFPAGTDMYFKVLAVGSSGDTTESYKLHYTYHTCSGQPSVSTIASKTDLCQGDSVVLTATGGISYIWDDGVVDGEPFEPTSTKTYRVRAWYPGSCASEDTITVRVNLLDTSLVQTGLVLESQEIGARYQWLDCLQNKKEIPAANAPRFNMEEGGSYAVALNKNGCLDTSACYSAPTLGLLEDGNSNFVAIFPNPVKDQLTIKSESEAIRLVKVMDLSGKTLIEQIVSTSEIQLETSALAGGSYLLVVELESGISQLQRFVKSE